MSSYILEKLNIDKLKSITYLYHGSAIEEDCNFNLVENIDLSKSNKSCDFGPGFYLTVNEQQARIRSESRRKLLNKKDNRKIRNLIISNKNLEKYVKNPHNSNVRSIVIKYPFDFNEDKVSDYKIFPEANEEWVKFIYFNRNMNPFKDKIYDHNKDRKYSLVFGYMADGVMYELANLFNKKYGILSKEDIELLSKTFLARQEKTGNQISLHRSDSVKNCLNNGVIL